MEPCCCCCCCGEGEGGGGRSYNNSNIGEFCGRLLDLRVTFYSSPTAILTGSVSRGTGTP